MKSRKNAQLIRILEHSLDDMCGVGTRRLKLFLNKKIKEGDERAWLYRQLLECEMLNINAKRYNNTMRISYREMYYKRKSEAIVALLNGLLGSNPLGVTFGYAESDISDTDYILYIDVPDCGQISFHADLPYELKENLPVYGGEWDGLVNSTMNKLERGINKWYGEEIMEKYL